MRGGPFFLLKRGEKREMEGRKEGKRRAEEECTIMRGEMRNEMFIV